MLRSLHLMTFDTILKSAYKHLVIKDFFSIFFRLITISIQNLDWNEIFLHIKRFSCFPVVHIFSFLHSMTFDLISDLPMQIQTWHPPIWLCTHAKYYVKSGLTNVLKNANKTKNMHLFSSRISKVVHGAATVVTRFITVHPGSSNRDEPAP